MRQWNVKLVCTTEDPLDTLEHHKAIRQSGFEIAVHTAWRPDKAMMPENLEAQNDWINKLAEMTNIDIAAYEDYLRAIEKRQDYFHENGCRLSDHGLDRPYAAYYTEKEIEQIFAKIRTHKTLTRRNASS
jgi:glucuronate isomerase